MRSAKTKHHLLHLLHRHPSLPPPPLLRRHLPHLQTLNPPLLLSPCRPFSSSSSDSDDLSDLRHRIHLLTEKPSSSPPNLLPQISALADALLAASPDNPPESLLSPSAASLLSLAPSAPLDLLCRLHSRPLLAIDVFRWRRANAPDGHISPEEYSKVICLAGRARDPDLASSLFRDALAAGFHHTRIYNALMSAHMYNGLTKKVLKVFEDLKKDSDCSPNIVTYNILLSVFGRSMLVDHMETVLRAVESSGLDPNLSTYNTVIAAYVTAWMWDRMEATFALMVDGPIQPNTYTYLLMLRGYAHAGNIEKMESAYEIIRDRVNDREAPLIRVMICAYCKSLDPERVRKIESLAKYIPQHEYRPWFTVILIRLYAQEDSVESMERLLSVAFEHNTAITTVGMMRTVISSYFRCNAVDQLAWFVKQATDSGWRLCRSLYHCKMVMYGRQNRLEEMHGVLKEMEACNFDRTKKTFLIMCKAYSNLGRMREVDTIVGMMWKHGVLTLEGASLTL